MIILIVIAILLIIVLTLYNNLVKAKNRVKQAIVSIFFGKIIKNFYTLKIVL